MTNKPNSVFTLNEIVGIENLRRPLSVPEWERVLNLCASHRVLHNRNRLLLRRVKELEDAISKATVIAEEMAEGTTE